MYPKQMYFIVLLLLVEPVAQPARWIVHPTSRRAREKIDSRGELFFSIPPAASRENAPVPAEPGRALSHRKHGLPESALICDIAARKKLGNVPSVPSFPSHIYASGC